LQDRLGIAPKFDVEALMAGKKPAVKKAAAAKAPAKKK